LDRDNKGFIKLGKPNEDEEPESFKTPTLTSVFEEKGQARVVFNKI
jgi:hypothetical protein